MLALARVEQDLREQLERTGLVTHIGQDRLSATLPVALDAFLPPLAVRTPAISESRLYI